jgi:hypothetical protein
MTDTRDWREAKMPLWARDAVQTEIDQWRLTAALAWPTEAKPEPLPFRWDEYDRSTGDPVPGQYWAASLNRIAMFWLARQSDLTKDEKTYLGGQNWKTWAFKTSKGGRWHTSVQRGLLFASEREAKLYRRWLMCEDFARQLMGAME